MQAASRRNQPATLVSEREAIEALVAVAMSVSHGDTRSQADGQSDAGSVLDELWQAGIGHHGAVLRAAIARLEQFESFTRWSPEERAHMAFRIRQQRAHLRALNLAIVRQGAAIERLHGDAMAARASARMLADARMPLHRRAGAWMRTGWRWRVRCWFTSATERRLREAYMAGAASERFRPPTLAPDAAESDRWLRSVGLRARR